MYRDVKFHPLAHSYRGVLVFRWDAPLHFANAAYFKMQLVKHMRRAAARDFQQHRTDVPDQSDDDGAAASSGGAPSARGSRLGIDEIHRRLKVRWGHMGSLMQQTADKLRGRGSRSRRGLSTVQLAEEVDMRATQVHEAANMDQALAIDKTDEALAQELAATSSASSSVLPSAPAAPLTLHDCRIRYVVIDCTSIVEVDDTALKMLMALAGQLQVQLAFCMLNSRMRDLLGRVHLFHAAALAAIDMQQQHHPPPPIGSTPSAAGAHHQHRISMSDLSATGLEEEIGLARPWASVHQAVKYVVEHMRLQGLKAAAAAAAAAAAQQGSSSLPTTPTQQSTSMVVTRAGDSDGTVVTNENGGAAGSSSGAAGGSGGAPSPSPPPAQQQQQQQQQKQPKQKRAAASASASASPPAASSSRSSPAPSSTPPVVVSSPSGSSSPPALRPAS
jgi:MFS superfamily sulfate permease-like transporter